MNKPWPPIPVARVGRDRHTRVAACTLSENKVTAAAKFCSGDGFISEFSAHLHLKRRRLRTFVSSGAVFRRMTFLFRAHTDFTYKLDDCMQIHSGLFKNPNANYWVFKKLKL